MCVCAFIQEENTLLFEFSSSLLLLGLRVFERVARCVRYSVFVLAFLVEQLCVGRKGSCGRRGEERLAEGAGPQGMVVVAGVGDFPEDGWEGWPVFWRTRPGELEEGTRTARKRAGNERRLQFVRGDRLYAVAPLTSNEQQE
jgi:hypothetical protein